MERKCRLGADSSLMFPRLLLLLGHWELLCASRSLLDTD
jgi:hypothetical protein